MDKITDLKFCAIVMLKYGLKHGTGKQFIKTLIDLLLSLGMGIDDIVEYLICIEISENNKNVLVSDIAYITLINNLAENGINFK